MRRSRFAKKTSRYGFALGEGFGEAACIIIEDDCIEDECIADGDPDGLGDACDDII